MKTINKRITNMQTSLLENYFIIYTIDTLLDTYFYEYLLKQILKKYRVRKTENFLMFTMKKYMKHLITLIQFLILKKN